MVKDPKNPQKNPATIHPEIPEQNPQNILKKNPQKITHRPVTQ